jgi:hypothetical protein
VSDEVDELLAFYPPRIAATAGQLRNVVKRAAPQLAERVRVGWSLIGYDLPVGRRSVYFAWIWPQIEHVHLGWQVGTLLDDPDHLLGGASENLKKVRYLTYEADSKIDARDAVAFTRQALRIASMSRGERQLLAETRLAQMRDEPTRNR